MSDPNKGLLLCDRFILLRRVGQGGMGEVWLANDKALEDQVALKILKPSLVDSADRIRLLRVECRHSRRLTHPNIVRVYDFHSYKTHHFISMEYVSGTDFRRFVGDPPTKWLSKLLPIIDALEYSHEQGFIHRDIKTSNILYDLAGNARLTDFGIAAAWARGQKTGAPTSGGSLYAMSPQQAMRHAPSPADDIYALGALIYELLTGLPPFFPHINTEKILRELPAPMRSSHPIPAWLEDLVMKMLAKSPVARPASMKELNGQLRGQLNLQSQTIIPPTLSESQGRAQTKNESITTLNQPTPELKKTPHKQKRILLTVWAAFVVLLALALAVLLYFPQPLHTPQTSAVTEPALKVTREPQQSILGNTAPIPGQGLQPWEQAQQLQERQDTERLVEVLLEKQSVLEGKDVGAWAAEAFGKAQSKAREGDKLARSNHPKTAIPSYEAAIGIMEQLIEQSSSVLQTGLDSGWAALAVDDQDGAIKAFQLALKIEPDNEQAARGLSRAQSLPRVLTLINSGAALEQNGSLLQALAEYQKASKLDPESKAVQTAISLVNTKISETRFNRYMSEGLAALERDRFKTAHRALSEALKLKPNAQAPVNAMTRLELRRRTTQIERHRRQASMLETEERWQQALKHYNQALLLDPTLVFAQQGKARSARLATLSQALDYYIKNAHRMSDDAVLEQAINIRDEAQSIKQAGPGLRRQIFHLSDTIKAAKTLVLMRLESDDHTEVTVYRIGKLGRFKTHELRLRPGSYTVVGTREGYRDVRHQFTIVAGHTPTPLLVRCEERI